MSRVPVVPSLILAAAAFAVPVAAQCERQELIAADPAAGDQFGISVDLLGSRVIVGANRDDDNGDNSGSAYIFELVGSQWVESAKLTASDGDELDRYGITVGLARDVAVVGARYDDDVGYATGAVYVYRDNGTGWVEEAKVQPDDVVSNTLFGTSLSIDGTRMLVGAQTADGDTEVDVGAAYVFVDQGGGTWTQEAVLMASSPQVGQRFGISAALDGDTAVVGAIGDTELGTAAGAAYVFHRADRVWVEVAKLVAPDGGDSDRFGTDLAISGDTIVVGAGLAGESSSETGAAYVFEKIDGSWTFAQKLQPDDLRNGDFFGDSVAMDGASILIGAWAQDDDGPQSGAAYIFEKRGGIWAQKTKLRASDAAASEGYGHAVVIRDGLAVVTAKAGSAMAGDAFGSAYAYDRATSVAGYGTGCAGSGGFVPQLGLEGCPELGGEVELTLRDGLGGAPLLLLFGLDRDEIPMGLSGCTLDVWPLLPIFIDLSLFGSGAGEGSLSIPATIPPDIGAVAFTMQAFVFDPGVPSGRAATNAVDVLID